MTKRLIHGPRIAIYTATINGTYTAMSSNSRETAHEYDAYIRAQGEGRSCTVTRFEPCMQCDGHGDVITRLKRGMVKHTPCTAHVEHPIITE